MPERTNTPVKKSLLQIFVIFIVTRMLILLVGALSFSIFPQRGEVYKKKPVREVLSIQDTWSKFDCNWYQKLAKEGYPERPFTNTVQETWGFMPLYPLCIAFITWLFGLGFFVSGMVVSNVCTLAALYFIYKLAQEKYGSGILTVSLILVSAGSFYLSIVYAEGLFLLLTSLVFYLSNKKRYGWAFILAGLASITRIQGCLLFAIPAIDLLIYHRKMILRYIPALLFSLLPMVFLMGYLYQTCGEPLAFLKIQHAWGSAELFPLQGFLGLISGKRPGASLTNALFWIMILWVVLLNYRKLPVSYLVFTGLYFLLSTSNESLYGATRYMLGILPVFIAVSISSDHVRQFFILINILFLALTISAFVTQTFTFI